MQAKALQERVVMDRAFDELELSAESLVQAARAGDDLAVLFEELDSLHDRFVDGLDEEPLAEFVANTRRELIEANVLGLARRGAIDAAESVLAAHRSDLPDGQVGFLERGIARGQLALAEAAAQQESTLIDDLERRVQSGGDIGWQADQLAEAGALSAVARSRLDQFERERNERVTLRADLTTLAREAADGGTPLNPDDSAHRLAAEIWYQTEGKERFAGKEGDERLNDVAKVVERFGFVPESLRGELELALWSHDPEVAVAAALQINAFAGTQIKTGLSALSLDYADKLDQVAQNPSGDIIATARQLVGLAPDQVGAAILFEASQADAGPVVPASLIEFIVPSGASPAETRRIVQWFKGMDAEGQAKAIASAVIARDVLPDWLLDQIRFDLRSDDLEVALPAAQIIHELAAVGADGDVNQDERDYTNSLIQLARDGNDKTDPIAEARENVDLAPMELPPSRDIEAERTEALSIENMLSPDSFVAEGDPAVEVGTAPIQLADDGVGEAPVVFDAEAARDNLDGAFDPAIAAELGVASAEEVVDAVMQGDSVFRLEPAAGMSVLALALEDGRFAVVRLQAERDIGTLETKFRVVGIDVREQIDNLIEGPEIPIDQLKPLMILELAGTGADGEPLFAKIADPDTGLTRNIEAAEFAKLGEFAEAYVRSNGTLGEEESLAIGRFIIEIMPITGEAISAVDAYHAFELAVSAAVDGDTAAALDHALHGSLFTLGAIPVLGGAIRPITRATARLLPSIAGIAYRAHRGLQKLPFASTPSDGPELARLQVKQQDAANLLPTRAADLQGSAIDTFFATGLRSQGEEAILRGLAAFDMTADKALRTSVRSSPNDIRIADAMWRGQVPWHPSPKGGVGGAPVSIGSIDFYWGLPGNPAWRYSNGSGWSHIIAKHGIEVVDDVIDVIAHGTIYERRVDRGVVKVTLLHNNHKATLVLSSPTDPRPNSWLLTGFEEGTGKDVRFDLSQLDGPVFFDTP